MLRSRCNWLGRNGISGYLRRFCLLVFFSLQEMFYICGIIQESMSGVILMGEFKI